MKTSTRLALAFLAFATSAGSAALAEETAGKPLGAAAKGPSPRFERVDADSSGDISFDEFSVAMNKRITKADANGDGKITVAEISAQFNGPRGERIALRTVDRFDANRDGSVTLVEIEGRQKKLFALLDVNDDGKIEPRELPAGKGKVRPNRN